MDEGPAKVAECQGLICCGAQRMDCSQDSRDSGGEGREERRRKRGAECEPAGAGAGGVKDSSGLYFQETRHKLGQSMGDNGGQRIGCQY